MDEGVSNYFKKLFDKKLGIVSGSRFFNFGNKQDEISEKERLSRLLADDEELKKSVNEFQLNAMSNILAFDEIKAKDIMVPRTSVFAVDINDEIVDILDEIIEERYSRVPVYDDDIDDIIGVIHVKDLFAQVRKGNLEQINLRGLLREPYIIHEFKPADKLLLEMQKDRVHMGFVVDEYGGFSGLVTIEDILEEIVGNIDDEDDEPDEEVLIKKISDTTYRVDGLVSIVEINEELNLNLPTDITETIGGLLLGELGKLPKNDKDKNFATIGNVELKAIKVGDKRILDLILKIKENILEF